MALRRRTFLQAGAAAALVSSSRAANDRVQVAMIGTGARAHQLMQAMFQQPQLEIVGVVDAYKGRVERARERTGNRAKVYASADEVYADKSIDAVVIATPDHLHHTLALAAMRAGKDVYCEKPLTFRASEGKELIATCRQTGRVLQVGSQPMSNRLHAQARDIIRSGRLGQITMVRAMYNRNSASGAWIYPIPPDASPGTVNWEMFLGNAPKRPFSAERFFRWRCYEDYSGGIATDLFVHLCTSIHFLTGAKVPSRVTAMGELYRWKDREVPDTLNAILEYPEGFAVNLSATFNNEGGNEGRIQVLGTTGTVSLGADLTFQPETVRENNNWIVESWPRALEDAYYRDPRVQAAEQPWSQPPVMLEGSRQYSEVGPDVTVTHLGHWLNSLRTRQPYWEDVVAGHHAAACAHMVNRAAKEQRVVKWDFAADDMVA